MRRCVLWIVMWCGWGCGDDLHDPVADATISKVVDVLHVPAIANRDVDLLFMIDDSTATLDHQTLLKASFPALTSTLTAVSSGLPNLHIGVVTSDLGTKGAGDAQPGPSIGSGPGACAGGGKQGNLQTYGTTLVTGSFISDTANTDGTRSTNYTGTLDNAFAAIASAGSGGCGFEQSLEAVKRALDNNPANAGFLRPSANLVIVLDTDEDDCSMEHSTLLSDSSLGPLQSFRCTRYGITCEVGGTTADAMNIIGAKDRCHSNEQSAYLTRVADYVTFVSGLKADPRTVMVGAFVGDATPVVVEGRAPPGGGTAIPALAHSCSYIDMSNGTEVADPAVRVTEFASHFPRSIVHSICGDVAVGLTKVAYQVGSLVGSPCLTAEIVEPPSCTVIDETATGTKTLVQACPQATGDCYELVSDPTTCPMLQHLKLQVTRTMAPPPTTVTTVSCLVP